METKEAHFGCRLHRSNNPSDSYRYPGINAIFSCEVPGFRRVCGSAALPKLLPDFALPVHATFLFSI